VSAAEPLCLSWPRRELVQVMARRGASLAVVTRNSLGLELPAPGHAATAGDLTALWLQPDAWLVTAPAAGEGALLRRAAPLATAAALIDQSHGRATFGIAGAAARAVLAKGCRIDLHPRAFGPGRVAATVVAHLNALLHQTAADAFELTVASTLAVHAFEWLQAAAAEYGYEVR
jgi:heterotetrameric sarcosine oxidase gamma subunit